MRAQILCAQQNEVGMSMRDLIRSIRARRRSRMVARAACCLGVGNDMAVCCSRASFSSRANQPTSVYSRVGDELERGTALFFSSLTRQRPQKRSHSRDASFRRCTPNCGASGVRPRNGTLQRLKSRGVEITTEPRPTPWQPGRTIAKFRDSEGNHMVIISR